MAKLKTTATKRSVADFISNIADELKRDDCAQLIKMCQSITSCEPYMWGPSIIGFGTCHYKYASGHEGDMPLAAFSPRKSALVIYAMNAEAKAKTLEKLGKHKASKGCIYIKRLDDIDPKILETLITESVKRAKKKHSAA
jgi:hypothetical protein